MFKFAFVSLILASLTACTTNGVEILNEQEVRVPAQSYVKEGDKAIIAETRCNMPNYSKMQRCWSEKTGDGRVVKVTDQTAIIRAEGNAKFTKQSHIQWSYSPNH